jgi:L-ribulokinase
MAEHGVSVKRVINAGGIPQKNDVLNQVYANILGRPVLVPSSGVTSLGSAIFAFLAAGTFKTVEEAQDKICPSYKVFQPNPAEQAIYNRVYPLYREMYFALGQPPQSPLGKVLPELIRISESVNKASLS